MVIPASRLTEFERLWKMKMFEGQRYGQAFYNYMNFHKTQDPDVEQIYNETNYEKVRKWIYDNLDCDN